MKNLCANKMLTRFVFYIAPQFWVDIVASPPFLKQKQTIFHSISLSSLNRLPCVSINTTSPLHTHSTLASLDPLKQYGYTFIEFRYTCIGIHRHQFERNVLLAWRILTATQSLITNRCSIWVFPNLWLWLCLGGSLPRVIQLWKDKHHPNPL